MKVIAVAGSGSGSGKTTLVCRILEAVPGLGAVKISPRETDRPRIEWGPGEGGAAKDTARYAGAGAVRVARIVAPRAEVPRLWEEAAVGLAECRGVVVEGSGALGLGRGRFAILVAGGREASERPERLGNILEKIDILVVNGPTFDHEVGLNDILLSHKFPQSSVIVMDVERDSGERWQQIAARIERFLK